MGTKVISNLEAVNFEDMICNYVDVVTSAKKIKNIRKRAIIIYKVMGYCDWEIAKYLGISERTIRRYKNWLEIFFKNMS